MSGKKRILGWGDYGYTGLGDAIREPLTRLHDTGEFDVALLGVGYDGWKKPDSVYPFRVFPANIGKVHLGRDMLPIAIREFQPDFLFTNLDVGWLEILSNPKMFADNGVISRDAVRLLHPDTRPFKHIGYFPFDGFCINDLIPDGLLEILISMDFRVTYSMWTNRILAKHGVRCFNIYHGINTSKYFPVDKTTARRSFLRGKWDENIDNAFIVGMIGTNQHRKKFEDLIIGFAKFAVGKSNVYLLPHTDLVLPGNADSIGAHDLISLIRQCGIGDLIIDTHRMRHCPQEAMNMIYNSIDVGVLLTAGEGFGLPITHHHAVSKPILATDCTACSELLQDEEKIPPRDSYISHINNLVRYNSDVDFFVKRLNEFYYNRELAAKVGAKGYKDIMSRFDYHSVIMPQWLEFFNVITREDIINAETSEKQEPNDQR